MQLMNARNILTEKPIDKTGPCEECVWAAQSDVCLGACRECSVKDLIRCPIADVECPECNGYGYHAFETNSYAHPPLEIQCEDSCDCCAIRRGHGPGKKATDTDAALLFVHDLELGVPHARAIARELLETEL
tara:strand:- start:105 stop:500 length:396 start_codon:yes stop_codon:yes gene_type:complete